MPTWPKFEVKADGFGEETQTLVVRDMYTTDEYIVVLFHKLNGELLRNSAVEPGKAFIQRYTYDGALVDQIETNYRTRRNAPGPGGSTLYVQKRFIEQEEGAESELRFLEPES